MYLFIIWGKWTQKQPPAGNSYCWQIYLDTVVHQNFECGAWYTVIDDRISYMAHSSNLDNQTHPWLSVSLGTSQSHTHTPLFSPVFKSPLCTCSLPDCLSSMSGCQGLCQTNRLVLTSPGSNDLAFCLFLPFLAPCLVFGCLVFRVWLFVESHLVDNPVSGLPSHGVSPALHRYFTHPVNRFQIQ